MSRVFLRSIPGRFSFYAACTAAFAAAAGFASSAFPPFPWISQEEFKNERLWREVFPDAQGPAWKESVELNGREVYFSRISGPGTEVAGFAFIQKAQFRSRPLVLLLEVDMEDRIGGIRVLEHSEPAAMMKYFEEQPLLKKILPGKNLRDLDAILAMEVPEVPKMRAFSRELVFAVREGLRFWDSEKELLTERLGLEKKTAAESVLQASEPVLSPSAAAPPEPVVPSPDTLLPAVTGHGRE